MNLAELLAYTAKEYLDDRTDLVDGDADSLWSDSFLVRQLNEAQRLLARRAWCIIDIGHPTAGVVVLKTGVATYPLDKSVLRVYDATPEDQEWPLGRTSDITLRMPRLDADVPFDINNLSVSTPGRPIAMASDAATRTLRVFRTPSATENGLRVILKVARLPVEWLTLDDTDASPEVPEDYHYLLCTFAAGKALTQPNVDGQMKADGRLLLAEFDAAVKEARQDRQRAEMSPATWGFDSATAVLDQRTR